MKLSAFPSSDECCFENVFEVLDPRLSYEKIYQRIQENQPFDFNRYSKLFRIEEKSILTRSIWALSRKDMEKILIHLPQIFEVFSENRVIPLVKLRYRRYMFRILFVLWQDYYDKPKFRNLFLYTINHPKSIQYADETEFSIDQLRAIALSDHIDKILIEMARTNKQDMKVFLTSHHIRRDSVLAIDSVSIFFLFCSAEDYIQFGSERLLIVIMRLEMVNRAKVLNNMISKLDKEQRTILQDVFQYFLYTYFHSDKYTKTSFWNFVLPEVKEILLNEFLR